MNEQSIKESLEQNFGTNLTAAQLWALVKFSKNVRLRCRNNQAFNNFCNRMFPYAKFQTVNKTRPSRYNPSQMETYPGLQIVVNNEVANDIGDDSEE